MIGTACGTMRQHVLAALALCALIFGWAAVARAEAPPPDVKKLMESMTSARPTHGLYDPPPNCRKPDGTFDQDAIVAQQKKRLETIRRRLAAKFGMAETPHYLIISNADAAITGHFVTWCERLYDNLGRQFGISPKERVWDGKCVIMLFNTRSIFEAYSRTFDGFHGKYAAAYFATEAKLQNAPRCVHICMPVVSKDLRKLQETFAHEGTHAFFELYKSPGHLPRWLHEGLAEYMTVVNDRSLRSAKLLPASSKAHKGMSISRIFDASSVYSLNLDDYSVCFTVVDFLLAAGRPKFKKFIEGLKEGKDQDTALKAAYGFTTIDLEERWRVYVKKYIRKQR